MCYENDKIKEAMERLRRLEQEELDFQIIIENLLHIYKKALEKKIENKNKPYFTSKDYEELTPPILSPFAIEKEKNRLKEIHNNKKKKKNKQKTH